MACVMFLPRVIAVLHFFRTVKRLRLPRIVAFWGVFAHIFAVVFVRHLLSLLYPLACGVVLSLIRRIICARFETISSERPR